MIKDNRPLCLVNLTHELRTPMIGILGSVDLLENSALSQVQRTSVDTIRVCGERLLHMIDDMLEASTIDSGSLELNLCRTDLPNMLKNTIAGFEANLSDKDLLLELELDHNLPAVIMADQIKLRQVVINLLSNAVQFTARGGIKVTAVWESVSPQNNWLQIYVADTGIGISQHQIENISTQFTQLESTAYHPSAANGLGLYISKNLIDIMGGELWVKSQEGMGTTFGFKVPVEIGLDEPCSKASPPSASAPEDDFFNTAFMPVAVLLVEDNELNQKLLTQMLLNYGFQVTTANNGVECLSILQRQKIDIILMDMLMPVMDGYEATRIIRANPCWQQLPIIAITANSLSSDQQKCMDCGCSSYLSKPFKSESLVREIKNYLHNQFIKEKTADLLAQQLIDDLLPEFMEMLNETLEDLKEALDGYDMPGIKNISHSLKGTAGMYGFMNISELAACIEKSIPDKNYFKMNLLYQQILALAKDLNTRENSRVVV